MDSKKRHLSADYKEVRNCLREPRHRTDLMKVLLKKSLSVCMRFSFYHSHKHVHALEDVCNKSLLVETECKKTKKKKTVKKK